MSSHTATIECATTASTITLFRPLPVPNRALTQLAYRIKFFPMLQLSAAAKDLIRSNRSFLLRKQEIFQRCNEDLNKLNYNGKEYSIVWVYNSMPTEQEWNGKTNSYLISVELRESAVIPERRVAILSFNLPSEYAKAHANGAI